MRLTVIPAPGSGLFSMYQTGQLERLFQHLGYYCDRYDVSYVTWGTPLHERALWAPFEEQTGARLVCAKVESVARVIAKSDVVRCMNLLATIPALLAWKPFVMSYGADYPALAKIHGRPAWKWRLLREVAFKRAKYILVPNEAMCKGFERRYASWTLSKIIHHPNWVDLERFKPSDVRSHRRHRQVLFVGRLVKEKNLEALADACACLPDLRLVCVGDGPLRDSLLQRGVESVGAQPWTALPLWYQSADVFCMPSLSEGHPKALTEAMACGVPCVVSEAVTEGGNAVIRTDDLVKGLQEALREDTRDLWGKAARQHAELLWDVKRLMPRELNYLGAARG